MARIQKALRLEIARVKGEPQHSHLFNQRLLNGKINLSPIPPKKLFADLLKRISRKVMQDVTTCPTDQISAHVARLDDLREIFDHVLRHDYKETPEANLDAFPLNSTYTLADFRECLLQTRKTHRCPAFVNFRDAEIMQIHEGINTLAGHIAGLNNENLCPSCKMNLAESEAGI